MPPSMVFHPLVFNEAGTCKAIAVYQLICALRFCINWKRFSATQRQHTRQDEP